MALQWRSWLDLIVVGRMTTALDFSRFKQGHDQKGEMLVSQRVSNVGSLTPLPFREVESLLSGR